jgi:hypothetical protein
MVGDEMSEHVGPRKAAAEGGRDWRRALMSPRTLFELLLVLAIVVLLYWLAIPHVMAT